MYTWQITLKVGQEGNGYVEQIYNIPTNEPEPAIKKARSLARKEWNFMKGDTIEVKSCVRLEGKAG